MIRDVYMLKTEKNIVNKKCLPTCIKGIHSKQMHLCSIIKVHHFLLVNFALLLKKLEKKKHFYENYAVKAPCMISAFVFLNFD